MRLPIHELKLDAAYTQRVTFDHSDPNLAAAMLMLARAKNLDLIAEGVETHAQADALATVGDHITQGFRFSH